MTYLKIYEGRLDIWYETWTSYLSCFFRITLESMRNYLFLMAASTRIIGIYTVRKDTNA